MEKKNPTKPQLACPAALIYMNNIIWLKWDFSSN